jgi:hypothetical protein
MMRFERLPRFEGGLRSVGTTFAASGSRSLMMTMMRLRIGLELGTSYRVGRNENSLFKWFGP